MPSKPARQQENIAELAPTSERSQPLSLDAEAFDRVVDDKRNVAVSELQALRELEKYREKGQLVPAEQPIYAVLQGIMEKVLPGEHYKLVVVADDAFVCETVSSARLIVLSAGAIRELSEFGQVRRTHKVELNHGMLALLQLHEFFHSDEGAERQFIGERFCDVEALLRCAQFFNAQDAEKAFRFLRERSQQEREQTGSEDELDLNPTHPGTSDRLNSAMVITQDPQLYLHGRDLRSIRVPAEALQQLAKVEQHQRQQNEAVYHIGSLPDAEATLDQSGSLSQLVEAAYGIGDWHQAEAALELSNRPDFGALFISGWHAFEHLQRGDELFDQDNVDFANWEDLPLQRDGLHLFRKLREMRAQGIEVMTQPLSKEKPNARGWTRFENNFMRAREVCNRLGNRSLVDWMRAIDGGELLLFGREDLLSRLRTWQSTLRDTFHYDQKKITYDRELWDVLGIQGEPEQIFNILTESMGSKSADDEEDDENPYGRRQARIANQKYDINWDNLTVMLDQFEDLIALNMLQAAAQRGKPTALINATLRSQHDLDWQRVQQALIAALERQGVQSEAIRNHLTELIGREAGLDLPALKGSPDMDALAAADLQQLVKRRVLAFQRGDANSKRLIAGKRFSRFGQALGNYLSQFVGFESELLPMANVLKLEGEGGILVDTGSYPTSVTLTDTYSDAPGAYLGNEDLATLVAGSMALGKANQDRFIRRFFPASKGKNIERGDRLSLPVDTYRQIIDLGIGQHSLDTEQIFTILQSAGRIELYEQYLPLIGAHLDERFYHDWMQQALGLDGDNRQLDLEKLNAYIAAGGWLGYKGDLLQQFRTSRSDGKQSKLYLIRNKHAESYQEVDFGLIWSDGGDRLPKELKDVPRAEMTPEWAARLAGTILQTIQDKQGMTAAQREHMLSHACQFLDLVPGGDEHSKAISAIYNRLSTLFEERFLPVAELDPEIVAGILAILDDVDDPLKVLAGLRQKIITVEEGKPLVALVQKIAKKVYTITRMRQLERYPACAYKDNQLVDFLGYDDEVGLDLTRFVLRQLSPAYYAAVDRQEGDSADMIKLMPVLDGFRYDIALRSSDWSERIALQQERMLVEYDDSLHYRFQHEVEKLAKEDALKQVARKSLVYGIRRKNVYTDFFNKQIEQGWDLFETMAQIEAYMPSSLYRDLLIGQLLFDYLYRNQPLAADEDSLAVCKAAWDLSHGPELKAHLGVKLTMLELDHNASNDLMQLMAIVEKYLPEPNSARDNIIEQLLRTHSATWEQIQKARQLQIGYNYATNIDTLAARGYGLGLLSGLADHQPPQNNADMMTFLLDRREHVLCPQDITKDFFTPRVRSNLAGLLQKRLSDGVRDINKNNPKFTAAEIAVALDEIIELLLVFLHPNNEPELQRRRSRVSTFEQRLTEFTKHHERLGKQLGASLQRGSGKSSKNGEIYAVDFLNLVFVIPSDDETGTVSFLADSLSGVSGEIKTLSFNSLGKLFRTASHSEVREIVYRLAVSNNGFMTAENFATAGLKWLHDIVDYYTTPSPTDSGEAATSETWSATEKQTLQTVLETVFGSVTPEDRAELLAQFVELVIRFDAESERRPTKSELIAMMLSAGDLLGRIAGQNASLIQDAGLRGELQTFYDDLPDISKSALMDLFRQLGLTGQFDGFGKVLGSASKATVVELLPKSAHGQEDKVTKVAKIVRLHLTKRHLGKLKNYATTIFAKLHQQGIVKVDIDSLLQDLFRELEGSIDMRHEATNMQWYANQVRALGLDLGIPAVNSVPDKRVLIMQKIAGKTLAQISSDAVKQPSMVGEDVENNPTLALQIMKALGQMVEVMKQGHRYPRDLHPGNLMVNGEQTSLLDFGEIVEFKAEDWDLYFGLMLAVVSRNVEMMANLLDEKFKVQEPDRYTSENVSLDGLLADLLSWSHRNRIEGGIESLVSMLNSLNSTLSALHFSPEMVVQYGQIVGTVLSQAGKVITPGE